MSMQKSTQDQKTGSREKELLTTQSYFHSRDNDSTETPQIPRTTKIAEASATRCTANRMLGVRGKGEGKEGGGRIMSRVPGWSLSREKRSSASRHR